MPDPIHPSPAKPYRIERDAEKIEIRPNIHGGAGSVAVRFFRFDNAPADARFLIFDLPPGASEGSHCHRHDDPVEGPYDEYYYILSGSGEMDIDGEIVPVRAGDYIFTPLGVTHGIANSSSSAHLRVHLAYLRRQR